MGVNTFIPLTTTEFSYHVPSWYGWWKEAIVSVRQLDEDRGNDPWMALHHKPHLLWHVPSLLFSLLLSAEPAGNNPDMTNWSITTNRLQL